MVMSGSELLAQALLREGSDMVFFLMGAPIMEASKACGVAGIRMIDVRHEQAAAMMAHASARVRSRPAVCMAAAGPGSVNLASGLANALIDGAPVVALGGASPIADFATGAFQEIDQVAVMRPVTKCAECIFEARRIPEYVHRAFARALAGRPGPVYLDLPGDVLHQELEAAQVEWPARRQANDLPRVAANDESLRQLESLSRKARQPIVVAGSGAVWSQAGDELRCLVDAAGIPFFAPPLRVGSFPKLMSIHFRVPAPWRSPRWISSS
jgi:thiamine pyrophosphate-dependent acetolactate synthase large subunit-like protein